VGVSPFVIQISSFYESSVSSVVVYSLLIDVHLCPPVAPSAGEGGFMVKIPAFHLKWVIPWVILILMNAAKVAISIDQRMLRHLDRLVKSRVFRSRSEAIQKAVREKLDRLEKSRLERECAKLSRREEQAFAEVGLEADTREWPPY
jgi:Arc/MetJ-type ribon-helix-helix transcriptional regulator